MVSLGPLSEALLASLKKRSQESKALGSAAISTGLIVFSSQGDPTNPALSSHGIGVIQAPDGEHIGISDRTFAFDTNRPSGVLKQQAASKLKTGNVTGAESLWSQVIANDTNDAETLIYQEDQCVLASGRPYITLVIGTILTGDFNDTGRDSLQGAYVAQKEHNDQCDNLPGGGARFAAALASSSCVTWHTSSCRSNVVGWSWGAIVTRLVDDGSEYRPDERGG